MIPLVFDQDLVVIWYNFHGRPEEKQRDNNIHMTANF